MMYTAPKRIIFMNLTFRVLSQSQLRSLYLNLCFHLLKKERIINNKVEEKKNKSNSVKLHEKFCKYARTVFCEKPYQQVKDEKQKGPELKQKTFSSTRTSMVSYSYHKNFFCIFPSFSLIYISFTRNFHIFPFFSFLFISLMSFICLIPFHFIFVINLSRNEIKLN